jgi:hypothetical protein
MRTRVLWPMVVLAAGLPLLTGCLEGRDVTLHEAGVYKGKVAPLVAVSATPAHQEGLRDRLLMIQTDR